VLSLYEQLKIADIYIRKQTPTKFIDIDDDNQIKEEQNE